MTNSIPYKNYFIQGESFQRENNGAWIPQYTVTRQESNGTDFPSHQYQFSHVFRTETEANHFALQKAEEWIDQNHGPRGVHSAVSV
ncbi:MAG: hypothetical protein WD688_08070 [Candidatus Binatia bacterium]